MEEERTKKINTELKRNERDCHIWQKWK